MNKSFIRFALLALAIVMLEPACSSSEQKAAAAASAAETALNAGQPALAKIHIQRALAERGDVSDYWLLLAHIDLALRDPAAAMDAYQTVLTFDRGNREALSAVCQLALATNVPDRAVKYADQLAVLAPDDALPQVVQAAVAFSHGDKQTANRQLDAALQREPLNSFAIMLKGKIYIAEARYVEAADLLEQSLKSPGDPESRLQALTDLYAKIGNRAGYRSAVIRLAGAYPDSADRQLAYADLLYDEGQRDAAYAVIRTLLERKPDDIAVAAGVLAVWTANAPAVPVERIAPDAAALSLEGKATYAYYASETGRPDLAGAILGPGAVAGAPNPANSDAKAAYAFATGLRGDRARARAQLDAILAVDPAQPRALLARARLGGDRREALQDVRRIVAEDEKNVAARLALVSLLLQQRDTLLAERILRDGMAVEGGDVRIATQLVRLLRSQGRQESAENVLAEFRRGNPMSLRVARFVDRTSAPAPSSISR